MAYFTHDAKDKPFYGNGFGSLRWCIYSRQKRLMHALTTTSRNFFFKPKNNNVYLSLKKTQGQHVCQWDHVEISTMHKEKYMTLNISRIICSSRAITKQNLGTVLNILLSILNFLKWIIIYIVKKNQTRLHLSKSI